MENSKFNLIRNYINSRGIGNKLTYRELIRLTSRINGDYNPNCYTVYAYCKALKKLGYLYKLDTHYIRVDKLIPMNVSYNQLREEYLRVIKSSNK